MNPAEQHIFNQKEPYQSNMLYVRRVILKTLPEGVEKYNYKVPYYLHNNKPICYLNILKDTNYVDVAFIQGILLERNYSILKDDNERKEVRSIQVKKLEDFDELLFVELLKDAAKLLDNSKRAWIL